jgi:hypothetical protein
MCDNSLEISLGGRLPAADGPGVSGGGWTSATLVAIGAIQLSGVSGLVAGSQSGRDIRNEGSPVRVGASALVARSVRGPGSELIVYESIVYSRARRRDPGLPIF